MCKYECRALQESSLGKICHCEIHTTRAADHMKYLITSLQGKWFISEEEHLEHVIYNFIITECYYHTHDAVYYCKLLVKFPLV